MDRRALIKLLTLATASPSIVLSSPLRQSFSSSPFQLGVASGSPSSDGFVLWTRLTGPELTSSEPVPVNWEIYDLDNPNRVFQRGQHYAFAELGYSLHIEISGLEQDQWYGYRFRVDSFESMPGRTRTLPNINEKPSHLRFAYASCQKWESGYYVAYKHMLREKLDLVVFVGDYIYTGKSSTRSNTVRSHNLPKATNLNDYRERYALYKSDNYLQRMHAQCPWLLTWDDHEVKNNYIAQPTSPKTKSFIERKAAAYQAYYEHMPLPASSLIEGLSGLLKGAELKLYGRVDFGQLASFHILDNRQYRDAPLCRKRKKQALSDKCVEHGSENSILGKHQEAWLDNSYQEAAENNIQWNFTIQQTRFTPSNYHQGYGKKMHSQTWDSYPTSRERIINSLEKFKLHNPIIIGGDIHANWVARVHRDQYNTQSPVIASEFCGTSISSEKRKKGRDSVLQRSKHLLDSNPHCLLYNVSKRGYGVIDVTKDRTLVTLRTVDNVLSEDSGISTLAKFVVSDGDYVKAYVNPIKSIHD